MNESFTSKYLKSYNSINSSSSKVKKKYDNSRTFSKLTY